MTCALLTRRISSKYALGGAAVSHFFGVKWLPVPICPLFAMPMPQGGSGAKQVNVFVGKPYEGVEAVIEDKSADSHAALLVCSRDSVSCDPMRVRASSMYFGFNSIPIYDRPSFLATIAVVPLPRNGSSTTLATGAPARMHGSMRSGGKVAKWAPLYGFVVTVHTERR